jgi:hypothetical protein
MQSYLNKKMHKINCKVVIKHKKRGKMAQFCAKEVVRDEKQGGQR